MAETLVRRATTADAGALSDCLGSAFEPFRGAYTSEAFRNTVPTTSAMVRRLAEMCLFVAVTRKGEIVGTVGYKRVGEEEAHIRGMAVAPEHQGGGVAQRLLDAIEAELQRTGCSRLSLGTTLPLRRAVSFYEKNGFRPSGRVSDFFGMPLFEYIKVLDRPRPNLGTADNVESPGGG